MALSSTSQNTNSKIAFLFPGQGSQSVGMGLDLYENSTAAKEIFNTADEVLERPLSKIMFEGPPEELSNTINSQPALLATSLATLAATKERFGSIDVALLNAGIEGMIQPITDYTPEIFDKVINVNVRSVFLGLRAIMPLMASEGGSIVITSSTAGIRAVGGMSAYVASKHAVIGLMRTAAVEGANSNIRVNTVNPSPINTRMISSIENQAGLPTGDPENRPMARHTPLQRYGGPEEVARLMLFLSSEDSTFCTGGVYMVDGGVSAGRPTQA